MSQYFASPITLMAFATLLTIVIAVLEAKEKHWIRAVIVFVAGLFSLASAIWSGISQAGFERELREKTLAIEHNTNEGVRMSQELQRAVSGADGYVYLHFETNSQVRLVHHGDYPVYDISLDIVDVDRLEKLNEIDWVKRTQHAMSNGILQHFEIGTIAAESPQFLTRFPFPEDGGTTTRFRILVSARNGQVVQFVQLKNTGDRRITAYRIFRQDHRTNQLGVELCCSHIDSGFDQPLDWRWITSW